MKAIFYFYGGEPNKLNKTLSNGIEKTINLKTGNDDLFNMEISVNIDSYIDFNTVNYLYIYELNRYYFINNITLHRNGLLMLACSEDVLMSFKNDILNLQIEITECSEIVNNEKTDYIAKDTFERLIYNFDTPFIDSKNIVLIGV